MSIKKTTTFGSSNKKMKMKGQNKMKKTSKFLLAAAMAMSTVSTPLAVMMANTPVFAVDTPNADDPDKARHTITISTDVTDAKYVAYQIFKGSAIDSEKVLANVEWGSNVDTNKEEFQTKLKSLSFMKGKVTEDQDITAQNVANELTSEAHAKEFAVMINEFLMGNGSASTYDSENKAAKISVTGDGYYLIKDGDTNLPAEQLPTRFILKVVNDTNASPKTSGVPTAEKKVKENAKNVSEAPEILVSADNKLNDVADYNIGDLVPFELGAVVPDTTEFTEYTMTFHDNYDKGFTVDSGDIKVYSIAPNSEDTTGTEVRDDLVSITPYTATNDKNAGFDVVVKVKTKNEDGTSALNFENGTKLIVRFSATLNENANLDKAGNENHFILEYSNNPSTNGTGKIQEDEVVVFTYTMQFNKVGTSTNQDKPALTGAEFKLFREVGEGANKSRKYLKATRNNTDGTYKVTGWADTDGADGVAILKATSETGNTFVIHGLDDGAYKLEEIKAPEGYNLPTAPIDIFLRTYTKNNQSYEGNPSQAIGAIKVLGTDATIAENENTDTSSTNIENTKGTTLPETGGMGTTMFYAAGAVMVGGAAVLLVTNKRMKKEDK